MKVLDTTVAVDHLRGTAAATELLERLVVDEPLAASEITRFDLVSGVRDDEVDALESFFEAISWVPIDESVTRTAGALARKHRRTHSGIDVADYVIAATAIVLDAEVLTTNVRHFPMFKNLRSPY